MVYYKGGYVPRGRPTKYKAEYCKLVVEFFDREFVVFDKNTGKCRPSPPVFFHDFAHHIGVCRDTIQEWRSKHPDFSVACKKAKDIMIYNLVKGGIMGVYNPAITCFTLKNIAGWKDNRDDEKQDDRLESELEFVGVQTKGGNRRFKRFFN